MASVAFSGGCSSGDENPVMTEEQKAAVQKEVVDQAQANDSAGKAAGSGQRRSTTGVMPP